jgi:lipopolysaccharide exporter
MNPRGTDLDPVPVTASGTLAGQVSRGAAWTVGMRLLDRLVGMTSTLVLARLLLPADFGLVAMATVVIGLLEALTAFGFEAVLISKAAPSREDYDSAWTLNALLGASLAVAILLLARPAARIYETPAVAPIFAALAILPLLSGLQNIGIVDFQRRLAFDRDFAFNASKRLVSFLVTVVLAVAWRNYWALAAGMIAGRAVGLVQSYRMSRYRPRPCLASAPGIFHFSKWLLLGNLTRFLRLRAAVFFLGHLHGPARVGMFAMANDFASIPSDMLVLPMNRAIFPGYSQVAGDRERLRSGYLRVLGLVALMVVPACLGLALIARFAVPLLLGPHWLATIPIIELLALAGALMALQANSGPLLVAVGRPRLSAALGVVQVVVTIALMVVFVPTHAAIGAAMAVLIASAASLPVNYAIVLDQLAMNPLPLLARLWRPLLGAVVMFLAVRVIFRTTIAAQLDVVHLALATLATAISGALVYLATVAGAWLVAGRPEGSERDFVRLLRREL